ncbi:hypothetical protein DFH28DRAFT_1085482 [Melampsora americana]|nr:hypothetical protein DFH28DRAFT_1085482 [Melampsora americana]
MGKKKRPTQSVSQSTSPTSNTNDQMPIDSPNPPQPPPPPTRPPPPPPPVKQSTSPTSTFQPASYPPKMEPINAMWLKVQTLDNDLRVFLEHNVEDLKLKIQNIKTYRIIMHFNPASKSRVMHNKDKLWAVFLSDVLPHLRPYLLSPPPVSTDSRVPRDFNPLGRKTTRKQLRDAILEAKPDFSIPSNTTIENLLVLYKTFIDKDLKIDIPEFIEPPKLVSPSEIDGLYLDEMRMSLQYHCPHIYIHSAGLTTEILSCLYISEILDEPIPKGKLVRGFHYSLFRDEP